MKKILLVVLLSLTAQAQVVLSENFNNFIPAVDANTWLMLVADSVYHRDVLETPVLDDLSATNHTIIYNAGWGDPQSSYTFNSFLYEGGLLPTTHKDSTTNWQITGVTLPDSGTIEMTGYVRTFSTSGETRLTQWYSGASQNLYTKYTHSGFVFGSFSNSANTDLKTNATASYPFYFYYGLTYKGDDTQDAVIVIYNQDSTYVIEDVAYPFTDFTGTATLNLFGSPASYDFDGHPGYVKYSTIEKTVKQMKESAYLAPGWVSVNGNVLRDASVPEWYQTAWNDTLIVPLPNTTLGNNQEWVLTSSNIDDVTAWIGSRSSAKSVKKSITGGVSFTANTTYFGDGFSLVSDSLVVVFPADTASIDNIVLKKTQHHLKSPANRGWLGW